jgi:hypothetical protein
MMPPRAAVWLLELFAPEEQAECIEGDLLEEFSEMGARGNLGAARRWYWRQALKSCGVLLAREFRKTPWSTTGLSFGGLLLIAMLKVVSDRVVGAILLGYAEPIYTTVGARAFWVAYNFAVLGLAEPMTAGWLGAAAGRRRGMLVPVMMSLLAALTIVRFYMRGPAPYGIPFHWGYLDIVPVAIFVGGVLGRMARRRAHVRPELG